MQKHGKAQDLFATYQKERDEARQARDRELSALQTGQRVYRQELAQWHREEQRKLREGWLKSLSLDKPAGYRDLAKQRDKLLERSLAEETAGRAKLRARAGRGDGEALAVLRSREEKNQRLTASLLRAETAGEAATLVLTARRPVVGRDGGVAYTLLDGGMASARGRWWWRAHPSCGAGWPRRAAARKPGALRRSSPGTVHGESGAG